MKQQTKPLLLPFFACALLAGCNVDDPEQTAQYVSEQIEHDDLLEHLIALEGSATATTQHPAPNRAAGTTGYQNSVRYIVETMKQHGYQVEIQNLDFRAWQARPGASLSVNGQTFISDNQSNDTLAPDFTVMSYSAASHGLLSGELAFVSPDFRFTAADYDSTDGCESGDFSGIDMHGKIAVIQRGGCSFDDKASHAQTAGAKAVIIFNQGNLPERQAAISGTLGSTSTVTIPVFGARFALGQEWYQAAQNTAVTAQLQVDVDDRTVLTQNILAETPAGASDRVVMIGAHLDSVPAGPGINDNGSGSAGLLAYAITLSEHETPLKNKIRFAWWAAEEAGLIGSNYYTEQVFAPLFQQAENEIRTELGLPATATLTETQLDQVETRYRQLNPIKMYLNFDMIGSPNYILGVMDGDLSDTKNSPDNAYIGTFEPPLGTSDIEARFINFFAAQQQSTVPQALSKRSDYAGFADWGVPFGGLFTGAETAKTAAQVAQVGGEIDVAYDICYHKACDDFTNVNQDALFLNTQALAYVTTFYAMSKPLFAVASSQQTAVARQLESASPQDKLRIGTPLKAAASHSDHDHFSGDFDQDRE